MGKINHINNEKPAENFDKYTKRVNYRGKPSFYETCKRET